MASNDTQNLAKAHSVVRWLSSKFGTKGAFKSSQVRMDRFKYRLHRFLHNMKLDNLAKRYFKVFLSIRKNDLSTDNISLF